MNYGLAKEIYGLNPWSVDAKTLPAMLQILSNSKSGQKLEIPEKKYNSISVLDLKSYSMMTDSEFESNNNVQNGIAIIDLDGPITVGGGMSSYGMTELSDNMLSLSDDNRVKGFIIHTNSGGGSSAAVEIMVDAINKVKKNKPVYGLIKKGGMAASAAYGILSATQKIFAISEMSIVGSCGTMIQFEGVKANKENIEGEIEIRLYATKSIKKNIGFEEALNNGNYTYLVDDLLNPVNEYFLAMIESNRPILKGTDFSDGHDSFAKDCIGTFIDGISTFNEVVNMVLLESNKNNNSNLSLTNSTKKMTKEEIKQAHPDLYSGIVSEGISAERERVKSLLVYVDADQKAVVEAINSGAEISPSQREAFMVKMNASTMLANLKSDGSAPLITAETPSVIDTESTVKEKEIESAMNFKL